MSSRPAGPVADRPAPSETPMAGLVLCGGGSRRMGRDKALLQVHGRPLVIVTADLLAQVADPVLVAPGIRGRLGDLGYREVADEEPGPGAGPLAALAAGLAASPHPLVAAVAVDMPFASPAVFRLIRGVWDGEDAVVPLTLEGPQPLHAVYAKRALPSIRRALREGRLALLDVLSGMKVKTIEASRWRVADPSGGFAFNVNRPEDLRLLPSGTREPRRYSPSRAQAGHPLQPGEEAR
jgi:molybdenum cofactor guanylyltransferase